MPFQKGQINNPKGRPKGTHKDTLLKAELAVRIHMSNLGYTDSAIALHIGMSPGAFSILKRTKEYQRILSEYTTGVISKLDDDIDANYRRNRQIIESAVPVALQNLAMLASQKLDKKIQLEASKEILDRHGKFGKVSRMGLATQEQGGFADEKDNKIANELFVNLLEARKSKQVSIESSPITDTTQ